MDFVLFAVNVGNVSRHRDRPSADKLCEEWSRKLAQEAGSLCIQSVYGHTGNFFLRSLSDLDIAQVSEILMNSLKQRFAVFAKVEFLAFVKALDATLLSTTKVTSGRRATPGAVMDTNPGGGVPPLLQSNAQVAFASFAQARIRGVYKNDILRPNGKTLDKTQREGGWGNIANLMKTTIGGHWTARSLRTLRGVADRLSK